MKCEHCGATIVIEAGKSQAFHRCEEMLDAIQERSPKTVSVGQPPADSPPLEQGESPSKGDSQ